MRFWLFKALSANVALYTVSIGNCSHANKIHLYPSTSLLSVMVTPSVLRSEEGNMLSDGNGNRLAEIIAFDDGICQPRTDPTPLAEHVIDKDNRPLISVPPYRIYAS
ncbi:hypothetical protein EVAR_50812_1 [Eumeta japonica]|uniref:Uncharacterized protein n=1 Tax=Eumeta variegata TaxID=151549 RepID=A0A4C1XG66_EUMVA|nr:hypothetical protein EVAR_50812_1 [Eumeta japonica]